MKKLFTFVFLLLSIGAFAQAYNNEWIDFSKTYYKFKAGSTGLYRIAQPVLNNAGLGGVIGKNFQLFRNGKEVPIYVSSGPNATLGGSDYIEFWGMRNDGAPDNPLYRSSSYQHTQALSLETDTAVYFLVENTSGNAFQYADVPNNVAASVLTPEPSFMYTAATYFKGSTGYPNPGFAQVVGEYIYSSSYDIGEFWATDPIAPGTPFGDTKNNLFVYNGAGAPDASLKFGLVGSADNTRTVQVLVNGTVVDNEAMNSFNDVQATRTVPLGVLSGGSSTVTFVNNSSNTTDRMVASFYELTYPRQFNFGGQANFTFQLPAKSSGYLLNITNFGIASGQTPVLYDQTDGSRYTAVVNAGTVSFALPGLSSTHSYVLVNESGSTVQTVTGLSAKRFVDYSQAASQGNYIIISNPILYTGSNGNNPVTDYKNYRSTVAGGSFSANVYDINDLVDQFAFGIKKHPLSIQNFLRYARTKFAARPQYVLLIGHGMVYTDYYNDAENYHDPLGDMLNMVPTFGSPASDNKLSASNGAGDVPGIPIGRISAVSGAEVESYLSKIKEYEQVQQTAPNTIDGRLWMKNGMHLTGVSEPYLGTILCNYVNSYAQIISDTLYGASVITLCDGNASSVSQAPGTVVSGIFSTGFSLMNYFGHSSNVTLGYNLDNPEDYNNTGKYPVFFVNGCDAGNFFVYDNFRLGSNKTLSESWVLAKDKGSIAFVASTHFGIVNYLNILLYGLYKLMDGADYGKPLGILEKDALQQLLNVAPGDYFARLHAEEMTIHGDPFLKLNQSPLADYDVELSQVQISPNFIAVSDRNFAINAKIFNLGKAVKDSITVLIQQQYPDGSTAILFKKKIKGIRYSDSVQLQVPIVPLRDKGQNKIIVTVNGDNVVPEITMSNNSVTNTFYIYENEATPIYPYNYAIINAPTSKLYASTANPLAVTQQYSMQIDTTQNFNSSLLVTRNLTMSGGVLEFDPGINYLDSVVYYWRVGVAPSTPGGQYTWNGSSFVYIDPVHSGAGFNQSHFFQNTVSTTNKITLDPGSRLWKFTNRQNTLYIRNTTFPYGAGGGSDDGYTTSVNGGEFTVGPGCAYNEMIINVYDSISFAPWRNDYSSGSGLYGSMSSTCGGNRDYNFEYSLGDAASRKRAMDFLNMLPVGTFVEIRSNADFNAGGNTYVDAWKADTLLYGPGNSLYHILERAGATVIDSFTYPRSFAAVYQKGVSSFTPKSALTKDYSDALALQVNAMTPDTSGTVTSPVFGPAKKWTKLHWSSRSLDSPDTDSSGVQVIGVDTLGNKTVLFNVPNSSPDYDISTVNAKQYPSLQLNLFTRDGKHATPTQLNYWRLEDVPAPEGAIAPNILIKSRDTVNLGELLDFSIAFKNVSPYAFDSLRVRLNIVDHSNITHSILLPKKKPLISGDTVVLNYAIDTKEYAGANTIYVDFNPDNDQPEQYQFNNFLYKSFFVRSDNRSPSLDVTFDNVHILNEDIVSARPHIQIKLQSQNQFLLLTDTSMLNVQLKYPDGSLHTYHFSSDTIRFTPATSGSNNVATIDFNPAFLKQYNPEGDDYTLIVTGKDQLNNTAGVTPYRVSFKIITKPMISNMLNYPNPFTTSTAFVFTITGSEVPQNIKIQILTITGKIVREITKEELGPLHIGRNITEFKWNGTDMYGSRLANGVYLYHVVTNLNGKSLDKYKAAGDNTNKYFNNGYGKMYLMK